MAACWECNEGCVKVCEPLESPQDFILACGRGAYTTIMIKDGQLVDWDLHQQRLKRSMELLSEESPALFSGLVSWSLNKGIHPSIAIKNAVDESLQGDWLVKPNGYSKDVCYMLVIVMTEKQGAEDSDGGSCAKDFVMTRFYMKPYEEMRNFSEATVLLAGDPRPCHEAKHTMWVQQRKEIEKLKVGGFDEVVLTCQDGKLLEGLATNFFIVARVDGGQIILQTANISDRVLDGTVRRRVIAAANRIGIKVAEEAPVFSDRSTWQEAFLTNSLHLIRPVKRIQCPAGKLSACGWEWASTSTKVSERLRLEVAQQHTHSSIDYSEVNNGASH